MRDCVEAVLLKACKWREALDAIDSVVWKIVRGLGANQEALLRFT